MSELIDRQALIKQLKDENIPFNTDINEIINIQPIAFDVANIVEKLEERRIEYELSSENAPDAVSSTYRKGVMRGYEYSRDLVKQEINNGLE